ncbi:MAG: hypothetical protein FWF84_05830 [Kiritimatiellaeota bacterium]|nr:hypothetical protein [Kiritimatiellota bacterium]
MSLNLFLGAWLLLGFILLGCIPESECLSQPTICLSKVEILKGERSIHPEERNLQVIGALQEDGIELLKKYIKTGKTKNYGYVLSEYYLRIDNQVIGIVEVKNNESTSVLLGLDITTTDTSKTYATSTHRLCINRDTELSTLLFEAIKNSRQ